LTWITVVIGESSLATRLGQNGKTMVLAQIVNPWKIASHHLIALFNIPRHGKVSDRNNWRKRALSY
jgi:hypothetical protein